ncbi:protein translocase subunit SecF [Garciella nitratireducens]|uniref:Protein-export membrane protein SecF n=1 Tax=Garciella nitratireducens DSM 15102 TaxID=1121911 RepID=A0A1T4K188_9FIRM|nr:protein translocase subunit SecF [Garciella nitratireducens]RBP35829.1 preprotein translocase subunit SecF [Garciella nitratireducens]SJZ36153.1 protein translocase subunit secF [Garciella nitratireducens DSM 15102]
MNFIQHRKLAFVISGIVIIIGIIFLIIRGLNLGIDFAGGTIITIDLHQTFEVDEIREIVDKFDPNADITYTGEDKTQVMIQTQLSLSERERKEIFSAFQDKYDLKEKDLLSVDNVDPVIGSELKNQMIIGTVIASIAMLIYITIRFEFDFALSAIIALVHDLLVLISFYAIAGIQVNSPFIVAILTVLGYSINDTIVIFDRIRENRRVIKKNDYKTLVNTSITQSLSRSINTSLTTLITITVLYILGVEAIKSFALPLIVGIISGTYSSIFIASFLWYIMKTKKESKQNAI